MQKAPEPESSEAPSPRRGPAAAHARFDPNRCLGRQPRRRRRRSRWRWAIAYDRAMSGGLRFEVIRRWLPGRMFMFRASIRDCLTDERIDVCSRAEAEEISRLLNDAEQGVLPLTPCGKPELDHYVVLDRPDGNWVSRIRSATYSTPVAPLSTRELADRIADLLNRVDPEDRSRDPSVAWSRAMGTVQFLWEPLRGRDWGGLHFR
jgi:hypothetical protein